MKYGIAFILSLAFILPFGLQPKSVFATTGLTIQPVKISQTLNPGDFTEGKILLKNASSQDVEVEMKVEDFIPTSGAETIQFVGRAPGVTTVRDWIKVNEKPSFLFKQGESREIEYTITAPKNAEPGGHFGVIFFKAIEVGKDQQFKVGTQVGMLVLVAIPGNHLQKGNILNFDTNKFIQKGPVSFSLGFENTGTVHFEPKGTITIKNMFGKEVGTVPIEGQVVLPTSIKKLNFSWNVSSWLMGKYSAVANIIDGEGLTLTTKEVSFYAFPIWYMVAFLVFLIILFVILKLVKSKVNFSVSLKK